MTRLALAAVLAAGAASFATPASAVNCGEPLTLACETVGLVCRTLEEDTVLGLRCLPLH